MPTLKNSKGVLKLHQFVFKDTTETGQKIM